MKNLLLGIALSATLLALGTTARAQGPASDSLTVFDQNHNIVAQAIAPETGEDPNVIFYIAGVAVNPAMIGDPTYLTEGDGTNSDIVGIASGGPDPFDLAFASDSEIQGVNFGQFPRSVPEGNGIFDATIYLDPALQAQGWTAQFISDPQARVPELSPSLVTFIGFAGLAGLMLLKRRQRSM